MNKSLQKDIVTENEKIKRRRASSKTYMGRHKTMCVTLSKERDNDILSWLDKQENRSEAVREALKDHIMKEKYQIAYPKKKILWSTKEIEEE